MTDVFVWAGNDRGLCESCGTVQPLAVLVLADDEHDTGPPIDADWDWYVAHVMVVQDRPSAVNRQPKPMEGQMTISDAPIKCEIRGCDSLTTTGICASCAMELDADDEDR